MALHHDVNLRFYIRRFCRRPMRALPPLELELERPPRVLIHEADSICGMRGHASWPPDDGSLAQPGRDPPAQKCMEGRHAVFGGAR